MKDSRPITILLVEDDDGDAMALRRAFTRAKIANPIIRAADGLEALDILKGANGQTKIKPPYLLLVDLNMPRMNGIELVQAIRGDQDLENTIVFMLTTSKRDEDKLAAYNCNVAGYMVKQTAGEDFVNLVKLVASYWQLIELPG